jgi:hypothetical protein
MTCTSLNHCLIISIFSQPTDIVGVGLGRVVRKVRQHPDDHEFESQRWQ